MKPKHQFWLETLDSEQGARVWQWPCFFHSYIMYQHQKRRHFYPDSI